MKGHIHKKVGFRGFESLFETKLDSKTLLFYVKVNLEASKRSTKMGSGLPVLPSLVVNIADFIQHITNGYFQSTVHRVINKTG